MNPINLLKFFWWLLRKNPIWILHMSLQVKYFVQFVIGAKENLIKATDNKKRVKEIIENTYKKSSPII